MIETLRRAYAVIVEQMGWQGAIQAEIRDILGPDPLCMPLGVRFADSLDWERAELVLKGIYWGYRVDSFLDYDQKLEDLVHRFAASDRTRDLYDKIMELDA